MKLRTIGLISTLILGLLAGPLTAEAGVLGFLLAGPQKENPIIPVTMMKTGADDGMRPHRIYGSRLLIVQGFRRGHVGGNQCRVNGGGKTGEYAKQ